MLATQPLALLPSLLGFVVFIHSAKEISAIPADIQGNSLDSSLFNLDPGAAEGASSDPTTQSYVASFPDSDDLFTGATSNSFLTDAETNQITEPYQSLSIANGDVACDINYSNELQLSNKVRPRGESCTSPQGIVGGTSVPSDNGDEPDDLGFNDFATNLQMLAVFQQNFDLCPSSRFLTSNIPVCRLPSPDGLITVIGAPWFNLRTVSFLYDGLCMTEIEMWCCHEVFARPKEDYKRLLDTNIDYLASIDNFYRFLRLEAGMTHSYSANICYRWS